MKVGYLPLRKAYDIFLKTSFPTVRSVRFYQRFTNRRESFRDGGKTGDSLTKNFSKAKMIEVPFEANAPEVTIEQLADQGLISRPLRSAIVNLGFNSLTPVQQKAIGPILENQSQDVITRAKTGTGKTFAFLIPMFQHLINTKRENPYTVKYVIVAPTRDLAFQIETETRRIQKVNPALKKFGSLALVGGTNFHSSIMNLTRRRPQIVIATPGRLLDVLQRFDRYFQGVSVKILDEADRLLEIGFQQDLERISDTLNQINRTGPDHIRTLLFSATLDSKVQDLSQSIMGKDECVFLDTVDKNEPQAHEKISQSAVISGNLGKCVLAVMEHLKRRTQENKSYKAILFTPTIRFTAWISRLLQKEAGINVPVLEFHGKKQQTARTRMVRNFKANPSGILVCTDVAARGLDFPDVSEVLQVGVPTAIPQYIHRIGRTARAGKTGEATLFMCEGELPFLRSLEKEAHIVIKDQQDYVPDEKTLERFATGVRDTEVLADALVSTIAYYRSNARSYGLRDNVMLRQIAGSYGTLLNDENLKLPISPRTFENLGLRGNRATLDSLDIRGPSHGRRFNGENFQESGRYGSPREKRWYDEEPFQNFMKRGKSNNRNFKAKFYERRRSHNPRLMD